MSDEAFGREIHERLLAGDPVAPEELCSRWLAPLVDELGHAFPAVVRRDEQLIADAVIEALLNYIQNPAIFRPQRSPLGRFLFFAARGDLLNALERQQRRAAREQPLDAVEDSARGRNEQQKVVAAGPSAEEAALGEIGRAAWRRELLPHFPDERDRRLLELMMEGERKTARYAEVLEIGDRDPADLRREVKRQKDRLGKRLRRLGEKLGAQPEA